MKEFNRSIVGLGAFTFSIFGGGELAKGNMWLGILSSIIGYSLILVLRESKTDKGEKE